MTKTNRQSICWDCKHSECNPNDGYHCPWAWDGKADSKWMRDKDGYIYRCPHFVESGYWRPNEVYMGIWSECKGVEYVDQAAKSNARRIVCLEKSKMYSSCLDALREMVSEGRSHAINPKKANMAEHAKGWPSVRFKVFGYTWVLLDHDDRRGTWKRCAYDKHVKEYGLADKKRKRRKSNGD